VLNGVSDSSAQVVDGRRVFRMNDLTSSTTYYGKRWCGSHVDVFQFTTLSEPAAMTLELFAPEGAVDVVVEWGANTELGNLTQPAACPASTTCSVGIPNAAFYYRYSFRSSSGTILAISDLKSRAAQ
jgi:hypothetical protein